MTNDDIAADQRRALGRGPMSAALAADPGWEHPNDLGVDYSRVASALESIAASLARMAEAR